MKSDKFDLLKVKHRKDDTDPRRMQVQDLRALARTYRDANNELVNQLWDLQQTLVNLKDEKGREPLKMEIERLNKHIAAQNYAEKFHELLEEIKALEIALDGYSEVKTNSPFRL